MLDSDEADDDHIIWFFPFSSVILVLAGIALIVLAFIPDLIPQALDLFFTYASMPPELAFLTDWITPEILTSNNLIIGGIILIGIGFGIALLEFRDDIEIRRPKNRKS